MNSGWHGILVLTKSMYLGKLEIKTSAKMVDCRRHEPQILLACQMTVAKEHSATAPNDNSHTFNEVVLPPLLSTPLEIISVLLDINMFGTTN